jgi:hypothetical protein
VGTFPQTAGALGSGPTAGTVIREILAWLAIIYISTLQHRASADERRPVPAANSFDSRSLHAIGRHGCQDGVFIIPVSRVVPVTRRRIMSNVADGLLLDVREINIADLQLDNRESALFRSLERILESNTGCNFNSFNSSV